MTISKWIKDREQRGMVTFSVEDVVHAFPSMDMAQLKNTLYRYSLNKDILSVYKGFYVIIPPHYKRSGVVPPSYYVNQLMRHLEKPYYVGLLNAAEIYGAAHQRPQLYTIVTSYPKVNTSTKKNPYLRWMFIENIPEDFLVSRNSETSTVNYSSAELTALDLVQYAYGHNVGGLDRVSTVLSELCKSIDFSRLDSKIFNHISVATFQRLGFILENILQEYEQAESLHHFLVANGKPLRYTNLSTKSSLPASGKDRKWKIRINAEIEIDDL